MEILNAVIRDATFGFDDHGFLTAYLHLDYSNGMSQGFGGYALGGDPFDPKMKAGQHWRMANYAADFVAGCLIIAGVRSFSDLKGKTIRVRFDEPYGIPVAIGHIIKDKWYEPKTRFQAMERGERP